MDSNQREPLYTECVRISNMVTVYCMSEKRNNELEGYLGFSEGVFLIGQPGR